SPLRRWPHPQSWARWSRAHLEEGQSFIVANRGHYEGAVQVAIETLTGALGNVETAMAGGALQASVIHLTSWVMPGTHRVIGAKTAQVPGLTKVVSDAPPFLDQSTQGPLRARSARREQDPRHLGLALHPTIDTL